VICITITRIRDGKTWTEYRDSEEEMAALADSIIE
jgi:hypothetical protein